MCCNIFLAGGRGQERGVGKKSEMQEEGLKPNNKRTSIDDHNCLNSTLQKHANRFRLKNYDIYSSKIQFCKKYINI